MEYLVSLNITYQKTLLNPSNGPILYYSNTNNIDELPDELKNDETFKNYIESVVTPSEYGETKITYFVLTVESERYDEQIKYIQDIFPLKELPQLRVGYIREIFEYLYNYSHKNQKLDLDEFNNDVDIILHIYDILKTKYSNKVSAQTIKEYLRSQLQQKYHLSSCNIDEVLKFYDDLIN